jgi:general secretion pathway protein G
MPRGTGRRTQWLGQLEVEIDPEGRVRRRPAGTGPRAGQAAGFTLLELMFAVAVVAILSVIAVGQFSGFVERSRIEVAKADIAMMSVELARFRNRDRPDGPLPQSLAQIGRGDFRDPWGRPYHYVNLTTTNKGAARKDRRLNPLNSDFDLFSAGKNGVYKSQISQKDSLDDVIRARDGAYIGVAAEF